MKYYSHHLNDQANIKIFVTNFIVKQNKRRALEAPDQKSKYPEFFNTLLTLPNTFDVTSSKQFNNNRLSIIVNNRRYTIFLSPNYNNEYVIRGTYPFFSANTLRIHIAWSGGYSLKPAKTKEQAIAKLIKLVTRRSLLGQPL